MSKSEIVQAAACWQCGHTWLLPDELPADTVGDSRNEFPLAPGVWGVPCNNCGGAIWVTEPIPREQFETLHRQTRSNGERK